MNDEVNHPEHYTSSSAVCSSCGHGIECIDITRHLSFNIGNAIKYIWRHEKKDGIKSLKKAVWYLNDQIKLLGGGSVSNDDN